jgi:hypothetical protein
MLARLIATACACGCTGVCFAPAQAADASTAMRVSVAVPRHATIVAAAEPACVSTPGLSTARVIYRVRSTSLSGIELVFEPAPVVEALHVRVLGVTTDLAIPELGGAVTLRGYPQGETPIEVAYTFALDLEEPTECVAWPVAVTARPL